MMRCGRSITRGYLPSIYQKVKVDLEAEERAAKATWKKRLRYAAGSVWPVPGLYGFYKAWRGGDYLLAEQKTG